MCFNRPRFKVWALLGRPTPRRGSYVEGGIWEIHSPPSTPTGFKIQKGSYNDDYNNFKTMLETGIPCTTSVKKLKRRPIPKAQVLNQLTSDMLELQNLILLTQADRIEWTCTSSGELDYREVQLFRKVQKAGDAA